MSASPDDPIQTDLDPSVLDSSGPLTPTSDSAADDVRVEAVAVPEDAEEDSYVYGFDNMRPQQERASEGRPPLLPVLALAACVALAAGGIVAFLRLRSTTPTEQQAQEQPTDEENSTSEDEAIEEPIVTEAQEPDLPDPVKDERIVEVIATLSFDGTDIGVSDDVAFDIREGHMLVRQSVNENDANVSPWVILERCPQRARALAQQMAGTYVQGVSDTEQHPCREITWVVANSAGNGFMSITFEADDSPLAARSTADLLQAADGYAFSDGFYHALGGRNSGYEQTGGTEPTNQHGSPIELTAVFPRYGTGE